MTVVVTDWREEYAYTLGLQAYIYGYPWVYLPRLRWQWVTQPVNPTTTPYAALHHFWHQGALIDEQYREGGFPTVDTLYSVAWVDVRREPVILSHPEMGMRYFTFQLASLDSDNFDYVGTRTTGQHAGHYAIVGPSWQGALPPDVVALAPSRTASVIIVGRSLVDGPADVANVRALQAQYRLTSLSRWSQAPRRLSGDRHVWRPFDPEIDPLAAWKTMNRAMTEDPPEARHAELLRLLASIGVGPCQRVDRLDARTKRGLARAAAVGRRLLDAVFEAGPGKRLNGWLYPPQTVGRAGLHDDFITRAALQCATGGIGGIADDPEEVVTLSTSTDATGWPLTGVRRYRLHFLPGELPPVDAFWSLTVYGADHNLVANPIERYAVGDRTPGLSRSPDGTLTLYVQHDPPPAERRSNWLPAPEGSFTLLLRAYLPQRQILDQFWEPPALKESLAAAIA
jgi:hypothetical protein